ncbi:MAG: hypothetical protein MUE44_35130 [Oscillatoriaceae cyanobacterium Prado104]|nr:hypothetical protein [Oscillatoriaceae cyanobacterium Prado104]
MALKLALIGSNLKVVFRYLKEEGRRKKEEGRRKNYEIVSWCAIEL